MIVTDKYCRVKISKKLFSAPWNKKKNKSNITSITLHAIIHLNLPSLCTDILDHLNEYHDCHGQILSSKNLKEAVLRVMEQQEEEIERNINNITYDT